MRHSGAERNACEAEPLPLGVITVYKRLENFRKFQRIIFFCNNVPYRDRIFYSNYIGIAESECEFVKNFIENIPDIYIKHLFTMRFIRAYSWVKISHLMGSYATEDCYRKIVKRYINSVDLAPNGVIA